MSERHETVADIIAELRERGECRERSPVVYDYADRFDAALKRERGDCARLREAVLEIVKQLEPIVKYMHPNKKERIGLTTVFAACEPIYKIANTALAAPPRNCDVMDWRTAWKIWREKFHPETPAGYSAVVKGTEAFMDWFAAPATEKEGGNK